MKIETELPEREMKILRTMFFCAVAAFAVSGAFAQGSCGAHGTRASMLVTPDWLAAHLNDPKLVILNIGDKTDYDAAHIPGAQFIQMQDVNQRQDAEGLSLQLMPPDKAAEAIAKFGISNDSRIILYPSKDWFSPMTRIYLTLDSIGLGAQTSILDGGLGAWTKASGKVTQEVPHPAAGTLKPCANSDVVTTISDVQSNIHHPGVAIVDGRDSEFYTGEKKSFDKGGHVPGAGSLPFSTVFDADGKLKSPDTLESMFRAAGVKKGDRVIVYCHIGQQATAVYFSARTLGYNVQLFDGSWQEWTKKDMPIETGAQAHQ